MNIISSCNSLKNNLVGNSDDEEADCDKSKTCDVDINSGNFDATDDINISPLMDSRVTTCTLVNGSITADKFDKGIFSNKNYRLMFWWLYSIHSIKIIISSLFNTFQVVMQRLRTALLRNQFRNLFKQSENLMIRCQI